jgi:23S rRNA (uracil1939-C5)-methyltransferase
MTTAVASDSRHEVRVTGITSEGAGVGRLADGRAVFVHRTAPGDLARVELRKVERRWARAQVVSVLEPGPERRPAPCPFYDGCGGCTLQHLTYPAQLRAKARLVLDALERIGKAVSLPQPEIHGATSEWRYRNRLSFTLKRTGPGEVAAGFHALERPWELIDVDGRCLLPEETISHAWDALRTGWGAGASLLPQGSPLRLTLWAAASGDLMLVVEGGPAWPDPGTLMRKVPGLTSVWHRPARASRPTLLAGDESLADTWLGEPVSVTPDAFLQTNREVASLIHDEVIAAAGDVTGLRVIDAYCGFGHLGRALARGGAEVLGIEVGPAAEEAAAMSPVSGFRALRGRVEDHLPECLPADLVILNPPRAGVAEGVMERLGTASLSRILYVSCDAATLARDIERLGPAYGITALHVFDLFPQSARVETLLILDRREDRPRGDA